MPTNNSAEIIDRDMKKDFTYDGIVMITLDITYPEIHLTKNTAAQNRINLNYKAQAMNFYRYAESTLYKGAIQEYHDSIKNNFPFRPYDAVMKYTVTLNDNCHLSTFFDRYEFTGGAHGNTLRNSDNWNLQTGRRIEMRDLFKRGVDYHEKVITQMIILADAAYKENPYIYFENYSQLIVKYFNPKSFNLTPDTLAIYYQQYEVGPYVSGFVTFNIPYETLGIEKPHCLFR